MKKILNLKQILETTLGFFIGIIVICFVCYVLIENVQQPETFYQLESYQLAKYSRGTYGDICYKYANRMKKLYSSVKKEHIIIRYRGYDTLTHYRVILFENNNLTIYTDSNQMGYQTIRTWYEFK